MGLKIPVEPTKLLLEYENKIPKLFQPKAVVVSICLFSMTNQRFEKKSHILNIYFEFLYDQYLLLP